MTVTRALRAKALLACLIISACGGGGGGNSGGGGTNPAPNPTPTVTGGGYAPNVGPGDTQNYLPLGAGNTWFYGATNSDPAAPAPLGSLVAAVNGTTTVLGHTATVLSQTSNVLSVSPLNQYYLDGPGGLTFLGDSDTTYPITSLIVPYVQFRYPVQTGNVSTLTGSNLSFKVGNTGATATLDFSVSIVNAGFESVSVPAGEFANALKQVTTLSGTAIAAGQSIPLSGTDTSWFVAGVGQVKDTFTVSALTTTRAQSVELRGFTVNGRQRGMGAPSQLALANNSFAIEGRSIASDGKNFLVVAAQYIFPQLQVWIGTLIGPDGNVIRTFNINALTDISAGSGTASSAVAFDGTNYLVVYSQDHYKQNPTLLPTLDAVRISPTGDILGSAVTVASQPKLQTPALSVQALTFDGARYLLVFTHEGVGDAPPPLWGQFIAPATGQADGNEFALPATGSPLGPPAVAFGGGNYLIVQGEQAVGGPAVIDAVRLSPAGTLLDSTPFQISSLAGRSPPGVAFDGTNFLVTFQDAHTQPIRIVATRISPSGVVLDGTPAAPGIVLSADTTQSLGQVITAFIGGQYWAFWEAGQDRLYGARVSTGGAITSAGANGFLAGNSVTGITGGFNAAPIMAANANQGLLSWLAGPLPNYEYTVVNLQLVNPPGP